MSSGTATSPNKTSARLVVTSGPDKGMLFKLGEELTHLGRGSDNTIVLSDPAIAEHLLSIVFRNGRYAVYTALEKAVDVDGNLIPHARWVWLPAAARLRLSDKTSLQFTLGEATTAAERPTRTTKAAASGDGTDSVVIAKKADGTATPKKARKKEQGTVARFITDRPGEALVTLGEDGHLPELNLVEGSERANARAEKKETNPLVLYGLIGLSLLVSVVLLLADFDVSAESSEEKGKARAAIRDFYGDEAREPLAWQKQLRQARLAASRGDRAGERRAYRRVLDQLNSEDLNRFTGLTGTPEQDEKLRRLIGTLLRD